MKLIWTVSSCDSSRDCETASTSRRRFSAEMWVLIQGLNPAVVVAYELYKAPIRWFEIPNISTRPRVPPMAATGSAVFDPAVSKRPGE
jgi:hypothetical protein